METNNFQKTLKQVEIEWKYGVRTEMFRAQRIIYSCRGYVENSQNGTEVYITNLPRNALEDVFYPIFSSVGQIQQMRIMMEFSGTNRGYGFVKYYDQKSADLAILKLNRTFIHTNCIGVYKSYDNCNLQISGIPYYIPMTDLIVTFHNTFNGFVNVSQCSFENNLYSVIVSFETHQHAVYTRKQYWPDKLKIHDTQLSIEWAVPEERKFEATRV